MKSTRTMIVCVLAKAKFLKNGLTPSKLNIKWCFIVICLLFFSCREKFYIVVSESATTAEKIAAEELAANLANVYTNTSFTLKGENPVGARAIYIGTPESMPGLRDEVGDDTTLLAYDGYLIKGSKNKSIIFSKSPNGIVNGVYGLLESLNYGSYIHRDVIPARRSEKLTLKNINTIINNPVVAQRINFAWHNFLSGYSAWDFEDWEHWITQSQKIGFNTIMLHSYGNSPMFNFKYNGKTKWVGRVANSKEGREWRIQHVNDIRRAIGGYVFEKDFFGSELTEESGVSHEIAVRRFTSNIIQYAHQRGMETIMSIDVDTKPAISQDIIQTLPEDARIKIAIPVIEFLNQSGGDFFIANPDTEVGYGYYKAQVQSLIADYPTLNNICLWFRIQPTPLMGLKKEDLPGTWQKEYENLVAQNPQAETYWRSVGIFALGKITEAYKKAAAEIAPSTTISIGTWFKSFLPAADYFISKDVPFIFLDYPFAKSVMVNNEETFNQLKTIASHRQVTPIYWGQEDNGYYYGTPLKTVDSLGTKSKHAKLHGFGIIQWMQKSSELFMAHMNNQLWTTKLDEPLEVTIADYVTKHFKEGIRPLMNAYFLKWMNEGTAIGRESGIRFITKRTKNADQIQKTIKERMLLLEDALSLADTPDEKELISYHYHLEKFISATIDVERHFFSAQDLIAAGKMDEAREETRRCNIEAVINDYAAYTKLFGITKEEMGLLVSMNLRWYPSYVQLRVAVGLDDLRFNFAPTNHEPLVHEPGWATYFFDSEKKLWETFGTHEVGGTDWKHQGTAIGYDNIPESCGEVMQTGLELSDTTSILVRSNPHNAKFTMPLPSDYITPGRYMLKLFATANTDCTFTVRLATNEVKIVENKGAQSNEAVVQEPMAEKSIYELQPPQPLLLKEERIAKAEPAQCLTYPIELTTLSNLQLEIIPVTGKPIICGLILEHIQ